MNNDTRVHEDVQDNINGLMVVLNERIRQAKAVATLYGGGIISPEQASRIVDAIGKRTN